VARYGNWLPPEQAGALADEDTTLATYQAMDAVLNQFKTQSFQSSPSQACILFGLETDLEGRLVTQNCSQPLGKFHPITLPGRRR